ncbi:MAG TPA: hypothetical protein VFK56_12605 [Mycobacterium sp.]|nr:hypothetical protein [Mycobacterium sp.]
MSIDAMSEVRIQSAHTGGRPRENQPTPERLLAVRTAPSAKDDRVPVKQLSDSSMAVVLFNPRHPTGRDHHERNGIGAARVALAETRKAGDITRTVAPHDVAMLRISPVCR